jgi:uncharacterized protein YfkK (UPF0435 family)
MSYRKRQERIKQLRANNLNLQIKNTISIADSVRDIEFGIIPGIQDNRTRNEITQDKFENQKTALDNANKLFNNNINMSQQLLNKLHESRYLQFNRYFIDIYTELEQQLKYLTVDDAYEFINNYLDKKDYNAGVRDIIPNESLLNSLIDKIEQQTNLSVHQKQDLTNKLDALNITLLKNKNVNKIMYDKLTLLTAERAQELLAEEGGNMFANDLISETNSISTDSLASINANDDNNDDDNNDDDNNDENDDDDNNDENDDNNDDDNNDENDDNNDDGNNASDDNNDDDNNDENDDNNDDDNNDENDDNNDDGNNASDDNNDDDNNDENDDGDSDNNDDSDSNDDTDDSPDNKYENTIMDRINKLAYYTKMENSSNTQSFLNNVYELEDIIKRNIPAEIKRKVGPLFARIFKILGIPYEKDTYEEHKKTFEIFLVNKLKPLIQSLKKINSARTTASPYSKEMAKDKRVAEALENDDDYMQSDFAIAVMRGIKNNFDYTLGTKRSNNEKITNVTQFMRDIQNIQQLLLQKGSLSKEELQLIKGQLNRVLKSVKVRHASNDGFGTLVTKFRDLGLNRLQKVLKKSVVTTINTGYKKAPEAKKTTTIESMNAEKAKQENELSLATSKQSGGQIKNFSNRKIIHKGRILKSKFRKIR